jgi:hypothetical protein
MSQTITSTPGVVDARISSTVRALIAYQSKDVRQLALMIGVSRTSLYNRLAGLTPWSAAEVKRAADALGVSVATLYDGLSVAGAGFEPATSGSLEQLADVVWLPTGTRADYGLAS